VKLIFGRYIYDNQKFIGNKSSVGVMIKEKRSGKWLFEFICCREIISAEVKVYIQNEAEVFCYIDG